ncbi:YY1-associated factor 2 isoform X2 [Trichomycterus rosablanca]|uniref:YY1-associated factor 2 isoform X2 n=1 Tax=Trichomycterus rosablanca TaxID=2290929 RepID=UPI002F354D3F
MGDKRSPTRPKRQAKPSSDDSHWDCSVCTFRNSAEAFKCMMCDVRKGTSTRSPRFAVLVFSFPPPFSFFFNRKPRPVCQLVAQQEKQQFASPTLPKKEKKERTEKEKSEFTLKRNNHKKMRPRLKNVDRSSAQHLEVTVGDLTVTITDFKEKIKTSSSSCSTVASSEQHSLNGLGTENTEMGFSRPSSPHREDSSLNGETH